MRTGWFFAALFTILLSARLCHIDILWAEENLPMAAAAQMHIGKALYRDVWFDKPPLLAAVYLAWGVRTGWVLRLAGAAYALLACWLAYVFARGLWSRREGFWAAGLLGFYLIFDFPSAVTPLAADLLMLAPHIAAVCLASRGQAFWSGAVAGVAFLINSKAVFVLAACALWCGASLPFLALGFLVPNAIAAGWLWAAGALPSYIEQVWRWGFQYAGKTFVEHPVRNGLVRTLDWMGFHAALFLALAWARKLHWRLLGWIALSLAAVIVGWRFFPRYYFQLLPAAAIAASRGLVLLGRRKWIVLLAMLVPFIRFSPRYVTLARDLIGGRQTVWADIAMDQDSRAAARLAPRAGSLFVWGFRPELFVYTGLPAASRFIDCQPLTGVPADRHLGQSEPVTTAFTARNRAELVRTRPAVIMDGLSLFNPKLAMSRYPDLRAWLAQYREMARTNFTIILTRSESGLHNRCIDSGGIIGEEECGPLARSAGPADPPRP